MNALPDDYISLVPKLLMDTMSDLGASFVSRVNVATGDVVPETRSLNKGYEYQSTCHCFKIFLIKCMPNLISIGQVLQLGNFLILFIYLPSRSMTFKYLQNV